MVVRGRGADVDAAAQWWALRCDVGPAPQQRTPTLCNSLEEGLDSGGTESAVGLSSFGCEVPEAWWHPAHGELETMDDEM
jgi:hypothetical protein